MQHDWIDAVLADLYDFACRNDLPRLATKVEEARDELRREMVWRGEIGAVAMPGDVPRGH